MTENHQLHEAIQSIYQFQLTPCSTQSMLSNVAKFVGARKSLIMKISPTNTLSNSLDIFNYDPDVLSVYNDPNCIDPRIDSTKWAKQGDILLGQNSAPNSQIKKDRYYTDVQERFNLKDTMSGVITKPKLSDIGNTDLTTISLGKEFEQDFFDNKNVAKLKLLLPHFENAQSIAQTAKRTTLTAQLVNSESKNLVLLIQKNLQFEPIGSDWQIGWNDIGIFSINHGTLQTKSLSLQSKIQRLVSNAIYFNIGGNLSFTGKSGTSYQTRIGPIPESIRHLFYFISEQYAILEVSPSIGDFSPSVEKFKAQFNLTPREAEVLDAFSKTFDVRTTADNLGIKYETARWHLKRTMEKSQTKNQAELVYNLAQIQ